MTVRVLTLFPARPLYGRPPGLFRALAFALLILGLFGTMLVYLLVFVTPDLVTDAQVRGGARLLRDATVTGTDCSNDDAIEICRVTVSAPVGAGMVERDVHYMFGSTGTRPDPIQVVADPAHPRWLTTDMALDRFWNRVASIVLGALALGALVATGLWALLRNLRRRRAWRRAGALAVPLRLIGRQRIRNGQVWTVGNEDGQTEKWPVPSKAEPFQLGADRILGLQRIGGTAIMPLDARLRWVDLTRNERSSVLAAASR